MEEKLDKKREAYNIFMMLWTSMKTYGFDKTLSETQWDQLIEEGTRTAKLFSDPKLNMLYRDMFLAVTKYYETSQAENNVKEKL
jgi:hypothetical protein